jgi:hypothetical protein
LPMAHYLLPLTFVALIVMFMVWRLQRWEWDRTRKDLLLVARRLFRAGFRPYLLHVTDIFDFVFWLQGMDLHQPDEAGTTIRPLHFAATQAFCIC